MSVVARIIQVHHRAAARPTPGDRDAPFDEGLWDDLSRGGYLEGVAPGVGDPMLLGLLAEELGRWLSPIPLAGSVVAAGAALGAAPDHELRSAVLAGTVRAALCVGPDVTVRAQDGSIVLDGTATNVEGLRHAQHLLVGAAGGLFLVDPASVGVRIDPRGLDLTRDIGDVTFSDAPTVRLVGENEARGALTYAVELARLVSACEAVGAAQRCLSMTVEHLAVREQFGRPIGTFQALQHRCAVIEVQNEAALAAVRRACRAAAADDPAISLYVATAAVSAGQALEQAASGAVQMHGGMGFTWEHDAHLYLRRSRAFANRPDSTGLLLDRVAGAVLEAASRA